MRYMFAKFPSIFFMSLALATLAHADLRLSEEPFVSPVKVDETASETLNRAITTTLKQKPTSDVRYAAALVHSVGRIECQQPADKEGKVVVGSKVTCTVQPMTQKEMQENICPPSDPKGDAAKGDAH